MPTKMIKQIKCVACDKFYIETIFMPLDQQIIISSCPNCGYSSRFIYNAFLEEIS